MTNANAVAHKSFYFYLSNERNRIQITHLIEVESFFSVIELLIPD